MDRRTFLQQMMLAGAAAIAPPLFAQQAPLLMRRIPSTGEAIPAVGLGSWITFNVGRDAAALARCTEVVRAFLSAGGRVIDSSPMYGSSQETIGHVLRTLRNPAKFSADKVWTSSDRERTPQVAESLRRWGIAKFDLLQVHNLLGVDDHLPALFAMKKAGRLRYVGITTSHGRRHDDMEELMRKYPLDFVQLTYNPQEREVEQRLLPLAQQRKIAVIVNRPFEQGELVQRLARTPLPSWAAQAGARSWAQLILKHILGHPAVTCVIPATTNPAHARENLDASRGPLPDAAMRRRIVQAIESA